MQPIRRRFMLALAGLLSGTLPSPVTLRAAGNETHPLIRLNLPGPGSLAFLPLEQITTLGFVREMGARLLLRYHPSGIRALEDMLDGNADFCCPGLPDPARNAVPRQGCSRHRADFRLPAFVSPDGQKGPRAPDHAHRTP